MPVLLPLTRRDRPPLRWLAKLDRFVRVGSAGALLMGAGCGPAPSEELRLLTPFSDIKELSAELDPIPEHRPSDVDCNPLTGWHVAGTREDPELEINTADCNYAALTEAAATSIAVGDHVVGALSYFDLTSPEPAEAHLAIYAGSTLIHSSTHSIPGPADVIDFDVVVTENIEAGTPIVFHLHNHGQNSWSISRLWVRSGAG